MNKDQCKQCSVSDGTHKPAEAVHQIQEPTVNQQLTIEREAFEKWLGIKPCGAAHDFGWMAWQARAALAATPAAAPVIPSELIEAVDAWFAQNTGLGGCSDKDVAELAAIFAAAAPVTLPEPWGYLVEGRIFIGRLLPQHVSSMVDAEGFEPTKLYTEPQMRALLATASAETEPFGYFKAEPFGWTDCGPDDEGAVALYEKPQVLATGGQARAEKGGE